MRSIRPVASVGPAAPGARLAALAVAALAALVGPGAPLRAASDPDPADLLPRKIDGYAATEPDGVFTRDTLFDLIDGGAEVYRSFNVRKVVSRKYGKAGAPDIIADVFDMGSPEDAFGAYHNDLRDGRDAGLGRESESVGGALALWKDRWFVSLVATDDSRESAAALDDLARAIDARLPKGGDMPPIVRLLPREGLDRPSLTAFHDWDYMKTRYDLGDDNILDLGPDTFGVMARYRGGDPAAPFVLLVARYPDRARARAACDRFRAAWIPGGAAQSAGRRADGHWAAAAPADELLVVVLDAAARPDINRIAGGIADRARDMKPARGR